MTTKNLRQIPASCVPPAAQPNRTAVPLAETIRGFKMIVGGECDHLPEQAFYMVGTIDEAFEKAKKLAAG